MIRFLVRFAGLVFLAASLAAIIVDGTRSIAAHALQMFSFGDTATWLFPARAADLKRLTQVQTAQVRAALDAALATPIWLALCALAVLLLFAGRRPRPKIGFTGRP